MRVTMYKRLRNLGDAFQTIAAMQWIKDITGYFYQEDCLDEKTGEFTLGGTDILATGYWGYLDYPYPPGCTALGIHSNFKTMQRAAPFIIGTRDHYTYYAAQACGFAPFLFGCWTSSF
jgi:hypothetical protein